MIDFIKTKNITTVKNLDWFISVSETTGEMKTSKVCEIAGLKFINKAGRIYLKGSIHKHFNGVFHNYNDFTLHDIKTVLKRLKTRFGIPLNTQIENIEFGVNIKLPYNPKRILNNVVLHRGEPFNRFSKGLGVECKHSQYFIKIYDKGKQFSLPYNLLRVEVKVIKMAYLDKQNIPVKTLNDLTNKTYLKQLQELLTRTISEIIFTDNNLLNKPDISDREKLIISNCSNPNYWLSIKPDTTKYKLRANDPEYKRQRKKYYREIQRFENILSKHSNLKQTIIEKIRDKFTDLLNKNEQILHPENRDKFTDLKTEKGTNLHRVYSVTLSPSTKQCLICGKNISYKKATAKYCSKKCKNNHTNPLLNPKNNFKRKVERLQRYPLLFELETILNPQQLELLNTENTIYKQKTN